MPAVTTELPDVLTLLSAAVAGIGGAERPGQVTMAQAVARAIDSGEHLAVQAGTGTGKSLAYLIPAARHAAALDATVVVSTATIALQSQLIDRDLPRIAEAVEPLLGRAPTFAILKGRRNYVCKHRLASGAADDPQDMLFDPGRASEIGRQVQRLREWAETTDTGDRDELVPGVEERAWRQVAVTARECIGAQRCGFGSRCFAERAREIAAKADIVVTNHALLAIDALEEGNVLPEHDVVIIDEAHDLVDRVTSIATAELSAPAVEGAARRCGRQVADDVATRLKNVGDDLSQVLMQAPAGRIDVLPEFLEVALTEVKDAAGACAADIRAAARGGDDEPEQLSARRVALAALDELHDAADRMLGAFGPDVAARPDVVWLDVPLDPDARRPPTLRVAPLAVAGLLAERLFGRKTVALTSATLSLGGSFEPLARQWGLPAPGAPALRGPARPAGAMVPAASETVDDDDAGSGEAGEAGPAGPAGPAGHAAGGAGRADDAPAEPHPLTWSGIDVGSPFDHPRSGILYVARHLPPPGRDGLAAAYLDELCELITAAGGRTLGLFSSMRGARQAAVELRERIEFPLLCQGDDPTSQLIARFAADEPTCLFGTLSLWQGVDVPGRSLQLVVIDRIPFPRPDDPLASARQRAVAARGGNGFMTVAAAQAALLLAQGTGRLLRTMTDRGVVAILDPRLVTARYGDFLRASLPPFWATTNPEVVRGALRRLAEAPG
ncbi:MAG TPA: ATP-dependent DNA helicase [Streptosporangiaceae bacterium]|nr:ATP-dependent DNA helicase [Streptosporangiaceae bacterium]